MEKNEGTVRNRMRGKEGMDGIMEILIGVRRGRDLFQIA